VLLACIRNRSDECDHRGRSPARRSKMKNFTIENETNNITVYGSAKEADAVPNSERFTSEAALVKLAADWPAARLVEIWNSLPGVTEGKKFKDRATAVARIWKALQSLGQTEAEAAEPQRKESEPSAVPEPIAEPEPIPASEPETPFDAPPTATEPAPHTPAVAPEAAPAKVKTPRVKKAPKPAT